MRVLLKEINIAVDDVGGKLNSADSEAYRKKILESVENSPSGMPTTG